MTGILNTSIKSSDWLIAIKTVILVYNAEKLERNASLLTMLPAEQHKHTLAHHIAT